jgi:hypothetical protein
MKKFLIIIFIVTSALIVACDEENEKEPEHIRYYNEIYWQDFEGETRKWVVAGKLSVYGPLICWKSAKKEYYSLCLSGKMVVKEVIINKPEVREETPNETEDK